jgi:hypothetical protein
MITPDLIKKIQNKIKVDRATYVHFFSSLNDPAWVSPLLNAGFFKSPEPPIREDGYISFPTWPESQYLVRVADKAQNEVILALRAIPSDIENQRVIEDYVQILLKIDPAKAVRFTSNVVKFLDVPIPLRVPDYTAELVVRFAQSGYTKAALQITEALLEVKPDPKAKSLKKKKPEFFLPQPQIKYRDYEYEQIIKKITPALADNAPEDTVGLYSKLLEKAITYKKSEFTLDFDSKDDSTEGDPTEDYSTIWRPDVSGPRHAYTDQPRQSLVTSIRDCLSIVLQSSRPDGEKLGLMKETAIRKYKVFGRIVEYVLRDYKDVKPYKIFYKYLAKQVEPINDSVVFSEEPYDLKNDSGTTYEELASLTDNELIDKLKTHQKADGMAFWHDSVADFLTTLIKNNPNRYVKLANQFKSLNSEFINAFISAITEVTDNLDEQDLVSVLSLGEAVSERSKDGEATENQYLEWSRMSFARFLYKLVSQRPDKLDYISNEKNISKVLDSILILTRDEQPSAEHEKKYGGDNMDSATLAINTTRGEAMHAMSRLLLWVGRNKPKDENMLTRIYSEYDWHLDKSNDPSPAIRSVYGQWLPWIWNLNKEWATANLQTIFSKDPLGDAAWNAYITLTQAFDEMLELTEPIIRDRIKSLKEYSDKPQGARDARSQFAQHIMVYYWRGLINLDKGSVTLLFFETADEHYRAEALRFIGFELRKMASIDDKIKQRLTDLWFYRLKVVTEKPNLGTKELEEFGSWFASNVFDKKWAITNLQSAIKVAHRAEPDFMVIEKVSQLTSEFPLQSIQILKDMIAGAREKWSIDSWRESAMNIVTVAFNSGVAEAKKIAIEQANLLVAKGYTGFREAVK